MRLVVEWWKIFWEWVYSVDNEVLLEEAVAEFTRMHHKLRSEEKNNIKTALLQVAESVYTGRDIEQNYLQIVIKFWQQYANCFWYRKLKDVLLFSTLALFYLFVFSVSVAEHSVIMFGSMRPTLFQEDNVLISKMDFTVHWPILYKQALFVEDDLCRGDIIIFTTDNLPLADIEENRPSWLFFSGKSRFVKRCIAKAGDRVFFYGGLPYVVDKNHKLDVALLRFFDRHKLVSVPISSHYINEWKTDIDYKAFSKVFSLFGMNILEATKINKKMMIYYKGKEATPPVLLDDLFGGELIGSCVLLPLHEINEPLSFDYNVEHALKIIHTPKIVHINKDGVLHGDVEVSWLGLKLKALKNLFDNLNTDRFIVENGKAYTWRDNKKRLFSFMMNVKDRDGCFAASGFEGVPNGIYEFVFGQCFYINKWKQRVLLSPMHPLCQFNVQRLLLLFNYGAIGIHNKINPGKRIGRAAFFREGSLYVDRAVLFTKQDLSVNGFTAHEDNLAGVDPEYVPFVDRYASVFDWNKDMQKTVEFIEEHGCLVPEGKVMVLGDNYAVSVDSKFFGCVPTSDIEGRVFFRFWPLWGGIGFVSTMFDQFITLSRAIVFGGSLLVFILFWFTTRRQALLEIKNQLELIN